MQKDPLAVEWKLSLAQPNLPFHVVTRYGRLHVTVAVDPVNRRLSPRFGRSEIARGRMIVVPARFVPHQYLRSAFITYPGNNGDNTARRFKVKSAYFKYSGMRGERSMKARSWSMEMARSEDWYEKKEVNACEDPGVGALWQNKCGGWVTTNYESTNERVT